MNLESVLPLIEGFNLNKEKERFIISVFACHDVVDRAMERFTKSELAYKRSERSRLLSQPEERIAYFREQDIAYNFVVLNTLEGAKKLCSDLENNCTNEIRAELDEVLSSEDIFSKFHRTMLTEYISSVIEDDNVLPQDAVLGIKGLDSVLLFGHQGGINSLFRALYRHLDELIKVRKDLVTSREYFVGNEDEEDSFLFGAEFKTQYDKGHYWALGVIEVLKVIVRTVCYVIIVCLIWEEEF